MKKLLFTAGIFLVLMTGCTNNSTTETTTTDSTGTSVTQDAIETRNKAKELSDSTKMLDKKLADPNSKYSPDSLK